MSTIKDIADAAGVSVTTVSIVLNGKAKERKISDATCKKVYTAAKELDYNPNLNARKLRGGTSLPKKIIGFFWPADYRAHMLSTFLTGIQRKLQDENTDIEIVIQSYKVNHLKDNIDSLLKSEYHGAIIGGASQNDIKYLERTGIQLPVVLLNRFSDIFSTITIDDENIGGQAARLIKSQKCKSIGLVVSHRPYEASAKRTQFFIDECKALKLPAIKDEHIFYGSNTIPSGATALKKIKTKEDVPEVLFCESDFLAIGAIHELHQKGIRIPQDVKIITVGFLSNNFLTYHIPSITAIDIPNDKVAEKAIELLYDQIQSKVNTPSHVVINGSLKRRDSL